jgi:predicted O-linked N-acetylglucosamine transferase (SPINDLY family)
MAGRWCRNHVCYYFQWPALCAGFNMTTLAQPTLTAPATRQPQPPAAKLAAKPRPANKPLAKKEWQRGCALGQKGEWAQAVLAFEAATVADPVDALYWMNLANALRHGNTFDLAAAAAQQALALQPSNTMALHILGECQAKLHLYSEAATTLARVEDGGNTDTSAMMQRASMLMSLQRPADAAPVLLRMLQQDPTSAAGHALLADAMRDLGMKRESVECMKTVLALDPTHLETMSQLSFEKRHLCDWTDLDADVQRIQTNLPTPRADGTVLPRVSAAFGLLSLPLTTQQQLMAARCEARAQDCAVTQLPPVQPPLAAPTAPIRLGFLSYDFREHPVAQLLVQTLELIDRSRFEVLLYSTGPDDNSPLRARVQAAGDQFVDLRGVSDQLAAERIRADGVTLLVDLGGHTRGHRLGVMARRPAPVQVSYLGYPGSTGADYIDYIVGDPYVTPLNMASDYAEKIAQLPLCMQPNGTWRPLPEPMARHLVDLPEDAFVMCAFNHTYKILPPAFDAWCEVLRDVPNAVLWMKLTNGQFQQNAIREAVARGAKKEQLVFAGTVPYEVHFARMGLADVFVDTWPYNAHTTAADALWAGVPVVTHFGDSYASRVAASVLNAAGLGELAFESVADYTAALHAMARDKSLLQPYREHLSTKRLQLPLFDCSTYTLQLQNLLARMAQRWHQGLAPDHLAADNAAA